MTMKNKYVKPTQCCRLQSREIGGDDKETEWRYNHRHDNKYRCLLQYLRKNPLS